jgi:zinc transport system substrate-binding protein
MKLRHALFVTILLVGLCLAELAYVETARIKVVASIFPLADFARAVGGERVEVITLIPSGASPHTFEPTPGILKRISDAKVFIQVGAGLEFWASKIQQAVATKGLITVTATQGMNLIREVAHRDRHGEEEDINATGHHGEGNGHGNPHVWLDPVLAKDVVSKIVRALIKADPVHKVHYEKNGSEYLADLDRLHKEILAATHKFAIKEYVTFHPSFSYFSRRYGLKEVGVIEESPGREPTLKHLEQIVKAIKGYRIKAVFAEPQLNPKTAEVIAEEAGVKVLILDPLGGPNTTYGSSYLDLMRHNLKVMQQAMT